MNEITRYLDKLAHHQHLTEEEASRTFQIMMLGGATPAQMAAVLVALKMKGETVEEITGAARVMRVKSGKIQAPEGALDTCGTGGDSSGSYNISTAVAFVVAACGVPVAKHGNRSITSRSGSADVLQALGVDIEVEPEIVEKSLHEAGICFMMAPRFHTAMRHIAPVRQELKMRTIFNLLGPLSNPASTQYQLLGVYDNKWVEPLAHVLQALGMKRAWVVHGSDGMDELTTTGISHVAELSEGTVRCFDLHPEEAGIPLATTEDLMGGDARYNAKALRDLLKGEKGAYRDIVLYNAAACLVIAGKAADIRGGVILAEEAIDSGAAQERLEKLVEVTSLA
jgi:anthranilate phosphoribosyltransferase